jgi:sigma54-dependent transcription regulator
MHGVQPGGQTDNDAFGKEQWARHYAGRMLQRWLKWRTPLGVAPDYIAKLELDLRACYDQPLLRTFIEQTY